MQSKKRKEPSHATISADTDFVGYREGGEGMKAVFKYALKVADEQKLTLPANAEILSVANQNENIVLYALVDTSVRGLQNHTIYIHGTGHVVSGGNIAFIGTVVLHGGRLMFHVFRDAN